MVNTEGCRKTTRLKVCNYESYQEVQQANNRQKTGKQQADNKQITTNKNDKNDKKNNIDIQQAENLDESYIKFNSWLMENAPNVLKIDKQITEREFLSLKEKNSSRQIMEVIESLDNYAPAPKKYVSVYSTVSEWIKRRNTGNEVKGNQSDSNQFEEIYNGKRTYLRGKTRFAIPDDAPKRPSNNHNWSDVSKQWVYLV